MKHLPIDRFVSKSTIQQMKFWQLIDLEPKLGSHDKIDSLKSKNCWKQRRISNQTHQQQRNWRFVTKITITSVFQLIMVDEIDSFVTKNC